MSNWQKPQRLAAVERIREFQRTEITGIRERVNVGGGHFALTSSDEFEELLALHGVPSVVYNYWNFVVISRQKAPHYTGVLEEHGYPGPHFFALGFGTSLDPDEAPWGGLPTPTVVIGSGRSERELRVSELWANHAGAQFMPVDYNMGSPALKPLPHDWYGRVRSEWRELVDDDRLAIRIAQNNAVNERLGQMTGRAISTDDVRAMMRRVNDQMDAWTEANRIIAEAKFCPVDFRDQMSMYQAMWHRGTSLGVSFIDDYLDEVRRRADAEVSAYEKVTTRLLYWNMREEPRTHGYLNEHGAAIVGSIYSSIPALYARDAEADPWGALAARNLFLFQHPSREWLLAEVEKSRADGVVLIEDESGPASIERQTLEGAGIPVLLLPDTSDTPATREAVDRFIARVR